MLTRLEASSDRQRCFVGDASHELRSPLATSRAAHEIAALHAEAVDSAATSRDVLAELDRLDHLVNDLIPLARADEHGLRTRRTDVDLDDLLAQEARRLRSFGPAEGADWDWPSRAKSSGRTVETLSWNLVGRVLGSSRPCPSLGEDSVDPRPTRRSSVFTGLVHEPPLHSVREHRSRHRLLRG